MARHRLPAEFEPVRAVWLGFDAGHEALTAGLVSALQPHVALKLLVVDEAAAAQARALFQRRGLRVPELHIERLATYFLRDQAVPSIGPDGALGVVDFQWSAYGLPAWCTRRHPADRAAASACAAAVDSERRGGAAAIAQQFGAGLHATALAMEGGGVEVNGQGLLIANEALYRQRNPGLLRAQMEAGLLRLPGIRQVIWLPDGLAEDVHLRGTITGDHVAWGTGGHTDEFVRFADPRTVLLAWPEDADVAAHPVSRLTRLRMQRCLDILSRTRDPAGQTLRVLKVPMPRIIERRVFLSAAALTGWSREWTADYFPAAEGRRQGQPVMQVATASYLNYVLANRAVVLPDYTPHGTPLAQQQRVRRVFEQAFPGRQISFVDAISANWVGGGMHCATLTQP
jgi:agmatine deiminase